MKHFLLLSLAVLLFSCHTKMPEAKNQQPVIADTTTQTTNQEEPYFDDTMIEEDTAVPAGFQLDSVSFKDTTLQIAVNLMYAYPMDASMPAYKRLVYGTIDAAFKEFKDRIEKNSKDTTIPPEPRLSEDEYTEFWANPHNYYQDDNIVSIRFVISMNTPGASHALNSLQSVNFDKRTSKPVTANDFFTFKTSDDSSLIIKILDRKFKDFSDELADDSPWEFYKISHIDFNLTKDTVCFNFSDYALGQGPSMMNYKVSKQELISIINPTYR